MKKDKLKKDGAMETKPLPTSSEPVSTQPKALEVPTEKFSATREVQPVAEATAVKTDQAYVPKKERRKTVVKQEVAAAVASGRDAGGGVIPTAGIGATNHGSYSGNEGTIAGGLSGTPVLEQGARSASRFGKKLDTPARKVDSTISEQIIVDFEESKPLSESSDSVQGYNGSYRNETLRLQKNQGAVPGSLRFSRSLDELFRDQSYFVAGQVVKQSGRDYADTPTLTYDNGSYTVFDVGSRGNFVPRSLTITLTPQAGVVNLTGLSFNTVDASTVETDSSVVNASASHALTHINKVEITRQMIDSKAGDEQMANWSPLGRVIRQPNRTLSYLYDLEQDTGAHIMMAYRKLSHALSYQINKASKDGAETLRPVVEMINAHAGLPTTSAYYDRPSLIGAINQTDLLRNGSPLLFLKMFDSLPKYSTKADFLLQPRSFKMHLENAKGSLGVFKTNPDLIKAISNMETFSTIGHEYDPTKPVCISDYATLVSPLNWNAIYGITGGVEKQPLRIAYSDVRNQYVGEIHHPLLHGIKNFISKNALRMYRESNTASQSAIDTDISNGVAVTINIPISYSLTAITAWELLVLASIQEIERSRIDSFREVLDFERAHGYPFSDLVKIDDSVAFASKNFTFTSVMEPLKVGMMKSATALTWRMPETFDTVDEDGSNWFVRYPWYFNEQQFSYASDQSATFEPTAANMSWPSSRDGIRLGLLDDIYSMDERTARLSLDRIVKPLAVSIAGNANAIYKYDMTSDGIPVQKLAQSSARIIDFIKLPREIGYFYVSPFGWSSPVGRNYFEQLIDSATPANNVITNEFATGTNAYSDGRKNSTDVWLGMNSYRARSFFGKGLLLRDHTVANQRVIGLSAPSYGLLGVQGTSDDLALATAFAANRGLNFVQDWLMVFAATGQFGVEQTATTNYDPGFVLRVTDLFQRTQNGSAEIFFNANKSAFVPFFRGYVDPVNNNQIKAIEGASAPGNFDVFVQNTMQKYFWTRLNLLPFAINPFDVGFSRANAGVEETVDYDKYDFLYMFNFAGFRASNFEEDLYNKLQEIDTKKILYVKDYFASSSPILE